MKFCDTDQLAEMFDVHRSTISQWIKAGMPIFERGTTGRAHKFKVADVIHWRNKRAVEAATGNTDLLTADEAKRRKLQAEAGLQEIELAKKKGTVVDLAEFERDLSNKFAELSKNIMNVPNRVSMQIVGESDESVINQKITSELKIALEVLSDYTIDDAVEESDAIS